jgi:hypothetical protein
MRLTRVEALAVEDVLAALLCERSKPSAGSEATEIRMHTKVGCSFALPTITKTGHCQTIHTGWAPEAKACALQLPGGERVKL